MEKSATFEHGLTPNSLQWPPSLTRNTSALCRLATTVNCITVEKKKTEKKTVSVRTCTTFTNYRGALRRACGIAVWRIAPLARRAHELRCDRWCIAPWMGMQMERACAIVYVHVYIICTCVFMAWSACAWRHIADVSGAAAGMQIMRRVCGCGWCYSA